MENDHTMKSEDQMEIMMMMQQMEKIPEFCNSYNDHSPTSDFSTSTEPHCLETLQAVESSSPFINFNFPTGPIQEPRCMEARDPFPTTQRWKSSMLYGGDYQNGSSKLPNSQQKQNSVAAMREMIFRIAVMQPIHVDPEAVKPPKRRNVKISTDPQSVAARHRRERISERIRILQRLVPGGTKMDTASMLDEAIHYVQFLKNQVQSLERVASAANRPLTSSSSGNGLGFPFEMSKLPSRLQQNVEQIGDV